LQDSLVYLNQATSGDTFALDGTQSHHEGCVFFTQKKAGML